MAENNNSNHVVTLGGLATFLNKLKSEAFYTRSTLDTEFGKYAKKNGNSTEKFDASELKLYYDGTPVSFKVDTDRLLIVFDNKTVSLNLSENGNIITSNDINPYDKADRVMLSVYPNGVNGQPVGKYFVSDPIISKFGYPTKVTGESEEMYATTENVENPSYFDIRYMQNPVGTIVYLGPSQKSTLAQAQGSSGVGMLTTGFYLVTSNNGNTSKKRCEFISKPSLYALYYCASGEGSLGHFLDVDSFQTIAVGGGSGTGDYVEATDDDINGLTY